MTSLELPPMNKMSSPGEWTAFLKQYAAAAGAGEWPGYPGASEEQLAAMEKRLKVKLPPSYRAFLAASNGWRNVSREIPLLRPVADLRWFRKEHPEWLEAYVAPLEGVEPRPISEQDYFNYAAADCVNFDIKHLAQTLCVSQLEDAAVLLLNPLVVWPDGEWEAWFFANWLPGAARYRSFADWMRHELAERLDEPFEHTQHPGELPTVYLDSPAKADRRVRPREKVLVLAEVLAKLGSKKNRERAKAAQQLSRLSGKEAVEALLNALKNDPDPDVRCEAAESLGRLRAPEAVEALIAAIDDRHAYNVAIHALGNFADERSAQALLQLVEADRLNAYSAAHALAERGDDRALAPLVRLLTSQEPGDQHAGNIAGRVIALFQEAGYRALEPLATHPAKETRRRAIVGVGDLAFGAREKSLKLKARELLERCLAVETDPGLRHCLEISVKVSGKET